MTGALAPPAPRATLYARFAVVGLRLWPAICLVCHAAGVDGLDLCAACRRCLPGLVDNDDPLSAGPCLRCGDALPARESSPVCARCVEREPVFARIVAPWRYAYPLDRLLQRLKHDRERPLARVFGSLLARTVASPAAALDRAALLPDCLLPVPLHPARLAERGFNQSADIAHWAGRHLGVPSWPSAARRIIDTGSLADLSRAERALRIRAAFRVAPALEGSRVAIVDDVLTSGATASELARECYDTGAASVELWVIARTAAAGSP